MQPFTVIHGILMGFVIGFDFSGCNHDLPHDLHAHNFWRMIDFSMFLRIVSTDNFVWQVEFRIVFGQVPHFHHLGKLLINF